MEYNILNKNIRLKYLIDENYQLRNELLKFREINKELNNEKFKLEKIRNENKNLINENITFKKKLRNMRVINAENFKLKYKLLLLNKEIKLNLEEKNKYNSEKLIDQQLIDNLDLKISELRNQIRELTTINEILLEKNEILSNKN